MLIYPVRNNAPLGFEPFDSAHGPKYVEGSQRLEFLTGFTFFKKFSKNSCLKWGPP